MWEVVIYILNSAIAATKWMKSDSFINWIQINKAIIGLEVSRYFVLAWLHFMDSTYLSGVPKFAQLHPIVHKKNVTHFLTKKEIIYVAWI